VPPNNNERRGRQLEADLRNHRKRERRRNRTKDRTQEREKKRKDKAVKKMRKLNKNMKTYRILQSLKIQRQKKKEQEQKEKEERKRKKHKKQKKGIKFGAWNTRRMGAHSTVFDALTKTRCMFNLIEKRGWEVAMLTDVSYGGSGVRQYTTDKETWTVVVRGKVAIAMTEEFARRWREGGTKGQGEETEDNRVMTI
jgi:hypothetical protein